MSRPFLISMLIHALAVAAIFSFFEKSSVGLQPNIKKISLNSIKIEKSIQKPKIKKKKEAKHPQKENKEKKPKAKSQKKAKSKELRVKSKKKLKVKSQKRKTRSKAKRAKSKKKLKDKSFKYKVKSRKQKIGNQKPITSNQLPVSNHKSLITNHKPLIAPSANIKAQIYQAINSAKVYPRLAKKMGLQGSVYTCFTVSPGGNVSNITTSGAHAILQRGARQTIDRAKSSFPAVPSVMNICVSINYILQ